MLDKSAFSVLRWMDMNQNYIHLIIFIEDILTPAFIRVKFHVAFCKNFSFVSGLWQVCFHGFVDPRHWYDTKFYGCWWVFEEEYYIIHDILLPGKKQKLYSGEAYST